MMRRRQRHLRTSGQDAVDIIVGVIILLGVFALVYWFLRILDQTLAARGL